MHGHEALNKLEDRAGKEEQDVLEDDAWLAVLGPISCEVTTPGYSKPFFGPKSVLLICVIVQELATTGIYDMYRFIAQEDIRNGTDDFYVAQHRRLVRSTGRLNAKYILNVAPSIPDRTTSQMTHKVPMEIQCLVISFSNSNTDLKTQQLVDLYYDYPTGHTNNDINYLWKLEHGINCNNMQVDPQKPIVLEELSLYETELETLDIYDILYLLAGDANMYLASYHASGGIDRVVNHRITGEFVTRLRCGFEDQAYVEPTVWTRLGHTSH
ncbi:hypothetical protein EDD85DRAFT_799002 [Armillaria nabsnona]|nr:hypothetical protein EDD85DRAFT_799002 [Armillaria nabsnona]